MKGYFWIVLVVAITAAHGATKVNHCKPKSGIIEDDVNISICKDSPCKLQKKTKPQISVLFTPVTDVKRLKTHVYAEVASIPLPFVGVDGTMVCDKIFTPDGKEKVPCPLKAGQKYLYKDAFDILPVYPSIKVLVHWSINDADTRKSVACFEIPAEIVN